MNTFSYHQKVAMARILLDIIHADGRIDARETFYFNQLKEQFGLHEDAKNDVATKNSLVALTQIKLFDEEQKQFFAKLMANMIVVDEDIDANEVMIYEIVCEFTGISQPFDRTT